MQWCCDAYNGAATRGDTECRRRCKARWAALPGSARRVRRDNTRAGGIYPIAVQVWCLAVTRDSASDKKPWQSTAHGSRRPLSHGRMARSTALAVVVLALVFAHNGQADAMTCDVHRNCPILMYCADTFMCTPCASCADAETYNGKRVGNCGASVGGRPWFSPLALRYLRVPLGSFATPKTPAASESSSSLRLPDADATMRCRLAR